MQILLWLVPPLAVTAVAMGWATWAGRSRTRPRVDEQEEQRRLERALTRPVPVRARHLAGQVPDRPSGVRVRPSQRRRVSEVGRR